MKKILLLGGSPQQIPAILKAKEKKYKTILCDYLPNNPGQNFADVFYNISTTDLDKVLQIAEKENIDGIVAYASDPAAPTAAFVAEKLGLTSNSYTSVNTLSFKNNFREFLKSNEFYSPLAMSYEKFSDAFEEIDRFNFPVMIKPIDSSGSKGVRKIDNKSDLEQYFNYAMKFSRNKIIVIEEFFEKDHPYLIGGDCFVINGKVEYWGLLNCHRSNLVNPLVPIGKSYPLQLSKERISKVRQEIQRVVDTLHINHGAFNIEVMVDKNENVFIVEMGPRNGGNMIPELLNYIDGVDLVEATIESAMGNSYKFKDIEQNNSNIYATYNLHTHKTGTFDGIIYKNGVVDNIIKKNIYKEKNDQVSCFDSADKAIGIIFLKFKNENELLSFYNNPEKWIEVKVR